MSTNILFEVTVLNGATPITLRMASAAATSSGVQINGYQWLPLVTKRPTIAPSWGDNGVFAPGSISYGPLSFRMSEAYGNNVWSSYEWTGALARIFIQNGDDEGDFASYKQIFEGTVSSLNRQGTEAAVELLGPQELLNRDLLTLEYQGTGNAEGPISLKGKFKPIALGNCQNVDPVQIDANRYIYQVHGYGPAQGITPYEYAQALDPAKNKGDASDYATLANLTLAPGEWATCAALGMFRLGGAPSKKVTADVLQGGITAGSIISSLLTLAGIPGAKVAIGSLNQSWNFYTTEQKSIGEVAQEAAFHTGNWLFADGTGTWQTMDFYAPKAPIALNADRSSMPLVKSYREINAAAPVWKVRVGHSKCWSVHSSSDVSPSLAIDSDNVQAALDAAQQARDAAAVAQADANIAKQRIADMEADSVLDRSEKAKVVQLFGSYTAERTGLLAQGTSYGLTTERTNYDNAYSQLKTYLEGLTPPYTDTSQITPIDRTTFSNRENVYLSARQVLLNAVANKTATLASWGGVSGPGKPADNATVGAPIGTNVGDVPAGSIADAVKDSSGNVKPFRDQIATLKTQIDSTVTTIRTDLDAEVQRAKGADDAINQTLTSVKTTADAAKAGLQDEVTLRASQFSALGNRTTTLEATASASSSGNAFNPNFARYLDGQQFPEKWGGWGMENGAVVERLPVSPVRGSPYATRSYNSTGGKMWGIVQTVWMTPGKWVIEATASLETPEMNGAGVTLSGVASLDFFREKDTNGVEGSANGVRTWSKMIDWSSTGNVNLHGVGGWDGFGGAGNIAAKEIRWFYLNVRPASDPEIKAGKALTDAGAALARITTEETVRANQLDAVTSRTNTLESRSGTDSGSVNINPSFAYWPNDGQPPYGWAWWDQTGGGVARVPGINNRPYAMQFSPPANANLGVVQASKASFGSYIVEFSGRATDWQGAGILVYFLDANNNIVEQYPIHAAETKDGVQYVSRDGGGGTYTRTFSKFIKTATNGAITTVQIYAMANWDGFGPRAAKTVNFDRVTIRPASPSEIIAESANTLVNQAIARIGTEETTRADQVSSLANRTTYVEASSTTALNNNAQFQVAGYNGGVAWGWSDWGNGGNAQKSIEPGRNGTIPVKFTSASRNVNNDLGFTQSILNVPAGWYVIEADVQMFNGNWQGAGMHINFNNGYAYNCNFAGDADINDFSYGGGGYNRRAWSMLIYNGVQANVNFYLMACWSGYSASGSTGDTHWHKCLLRPATDGEIRGKKALDNVGSLNARVSTTEGAISNLNGRTAAFWQVQTVAGNNRAQLGLYADANGGAGVDIVGDVAIRGSNGNGYTAISGAGVEVFYPNGQRAVRLGI